jgi:hypothetical protein
MMMKVSWMELVRVIKWQFAWRGGGHFNFPAAHTDLSIFLQKKSRQLVQEIAALNGTLDLMLPLKILYSFFLMQQIISLITP